MSAQAFFDLWMGVEPKTFDDLRALLYDEQTDSKKPWFDENPAFTHIWGRDGNGYVQMRGKGWAADATVVEFRCGDYFWSHALSCNNNSFYIYHKGHLALQSGVYDDYYRGDHGAHYYPRTLASNSMLVYQPDEFWWPRDPQPAYGGQRLPYIGGSTDFTFDEYLSRLDAKKHFEMGEITAFEHAPDHSWSYVCGDATDAYSNPKYCDSADGRENKPKIDLFTRSLVYLPETNNLLVFDRVNALEASYRKAWLLHCVGEPHVDGKMTAAQVPGHIEDFDGDTVKISWEGGVIPPPDHDDPGRLFIRTFLPKEHYTRKIGGEGYEFWAGGKNRPVVRYKGCLAQGTPHPIEAGKWRIEVSPSVPARFDNFLHLIHICDATVEAIPPARMVQADGDKMVGLAVGGWVVMFGTKGQVEGEVSYRAPDASTEHLLVDLKRETRFTITGAVGSAATMTSSKEGSLRFTAAERATVTIRPVQ